MDKVTRARSNNNRNRKSKKQRKTLRKRREQMKIEVRNLKSEKLNSILSSKSCKIMKKDYEEPVANSANAFWENYTAGYDWQRRHTVLWWKTRCEALERENEILRDTVRKLGKSRNALPSQSISVEPIFSNENTLQAEEREFEAEEEQEDELEFQVNDEMMAFLEQSIRHKIELKEQREKEDMKSKEQEESEREIKIEGLSWVKEREKGAKILYGKADDKILSLETALQAMVNKHKDNFKPRYWPNIPLVL